MIIHKNLLLNSLYNLLVVLLLYAVQRLNLDNMFTIAIGEITLMVGMFFTPLFLIYLAYTILLDEQWKSPAHWVALLAVISAALLLYHIAMTTEFRPSGG